MKGDVTVGVGNRLVDCNIADRCASLVNAPRRNCCVDNRFTDAGNCWGGTPYLANWRIVL
jgi:hypothetical protein